MHIVALQYDIAWEDKAANHRLVESTLDGAGLEPGTFVLLPELGDTGFSFNLDVIADGATVPWAQALARRHQVWVQAGYAVRGGDGKGRNCATIIGPDGEVAATFAKIHPFSYGREIEHFGGGDAIVVTPWTAGATTITVAPMICYDLRFPELWRLAALAGAECFTIGASWPAARQGHWRALLIARAIENQAYVVAVNRVGNDPHLEYAGGSMIISPTGEVLAEAGDEPALVRAALEPGAVRDWRRDFPALKDIRRGLLGDVQQG